MPHQTQAERPCCEKCKPGNPCFLHCNGQTYFPCPKPPLTKPQDSLPIDEQDKLNPKGEGCDCLGLTTSSRGCSVCGLSSHPQGEEGNSASGSASHSASVEGWIKRWRGLVGDSDTNQEASLLMILAEQKSSLLRKIEGLKIGSTPEGSMIATSKVIMTTERAQDVYDSMIKPSLVALLQEGEEEKKI